MRKKILFVLLLILPSTIKAGPLSILFPTNIPRNSFQELLDKIINALVGIASSIALWFLIVGAFQYITSAGNPEGVSKAKNTILYAIIGLLVTIGSFVVIKFIINSF